MELVHDVAMSWSPADVIARTRQLVPELRERILETEDLRRLPETTIQQARAAGLFSLLLPASLDGAAGGVRDFAEVVRILAHGDPTAAWTLGFLIEHNWMLARWPAPTQAEVFADRGPALMAAVANPPGKAVATQGGYLVSGYWGYCSGVMHAEWVQVSATVEGADRPSLFLLPRDDVDVQDTWYMSGMKGSGSHDVKLDQQFVPAHRSVDINLWHSRHNHGATLYPEPLYAYDARDLLVFIVPALVVGAAEAMLELYRERLEYRRAAFTPTLQADTATGQLRYARSVSALRAAKAVLDSALDTTVTLNAASTDELSDDVRALIKLDCLSVCRLAWQSIETGAGGSGSAIYKTSDITQHFLRDIQMILSHLTIDEDGMQSKAGEILLGRATDADPARNFT
jgi:alkylation response protein AidB-like acyl-CoA dehydrogenase